MVEKERRVSSRSLENLKLGAESRRQGKVRHNFTIMPETVEWLKGTGNASAMIDELAAAAIKYAGNASGMADELAAAAFKHISSPSVTDNKAIAATESNHTHNKKDEDNFVSNHVYEQIEALKAELEQLRSKRTQLDKEIDQLHARNGALDLQVTNLQEKLAQVHESDSNYLPDLEAVRDRIVSRWKVQKRAESKDRIKEALNKFIAEVRSLYG